jgi:hypothetical protein
MKRIMITIRICLALFVIFAIQSAYAQDIPFEHIIVDPAGSAPEDPYGKSVGDINNDGRIDLVAGGRSGGGLVWYENPNWIKHFIDSGSGYSTDHEVVDIDKDGDNDLAIVTATNVRWYENTNGIGTSWAEHVIEARKMHDIEVADFNEDGRLDIVARNQGSTGNALHFYMQNSPTSWTHSEMSIPFGEGLLVDDVNVDGKEDIIINSQWYENTGSSWTPHVYSSTWTHGDVYIANGDINGDGRSDIIISPSEAAGGTYRISWFEAPVNRYDIWTEHIIDQNVETVHHFIGAGDFDMDGEIDVATAEMHQGSNPDEVRIYINQGYGQSWTAQVIATTGSHSMKIDDIDGDGDLDLYGANWHSSAPNGAPIELWLNSLDTGLSLDNWQYIQIDNSRGVRSFGLAIGDLTGNGFGDIASGPYFYRNPGGDMTTAWPRINLPVPNFDALLIVDVDSDQYGDVIGMDGTGKVYWAEAQNLQGSSWQTIEVGTVETADHGISTQGYVLGQLIAGGHPEIIINVGTLYYFEIPSNPEAGNWPRVTIANTVDPEGVAVGDIDRDGDIDVCGPYTSTDVAWWENPGTAEGGWARYQVGSTPSSYADRFYMADFNNDNKIDIAVAVANGAANGLYWFEQPSNPKTSWIRHTIVTQDTTNSMDVADMDNDGDMDIISGEHRGSETLAIWENNGTGYFEEHVVDTGKESHLGARVFDFDADGDLDIASIAWDDYQFLHLWRNDAVKDVSPNPPNAPSNLAAVAKSSYRIDLSWNDNSDNEMGFEIQRRPEDNSTWTTVTTVSANVHNYTDTGLTPNTTYYYRVRAFNSAGNSQYCTPASATTLAPSQGELVAHWKFDKGFGTTAEDSSGNGNDGLIYGANRTTDSKLGGYALGFDGVDDYVDLGAMNVEGSEMTIIAWFRSNNLESCGSNWADCRIISKSLNSDSESAHYWMLSTIENPSTSNNWYLRFRLKTDGTTDTLIANSGLLSNDEWVHAAAVYNGSHMVLYKNGAEVGSKVKSGTISTSDTTIATIGRNGDLSDYYWNGVIDEVMIYSRALSPGEILELYNQAFHGADNNPQDGCVETHELLIFIDRWKVSSRDVPMPEVMKAIGLWNQGTGC